MLWIEGDAKLEEESKKIWKRWDFENIVYYRKNM